MKFDVCDFLSRLLLDMPHHQFWSQLVNDRVLHRRLGQLIQNLPRRWQLKQHKTIQKSESGSESVCQAMLDDLLRDTFLVFVRMSTPKESPEHFISPEFYGRLVYDNFLWDVPRSSHKNTHFFSVDIFLNRRYPAVNRSDPSPRCVLLSVFAEK